MPEIKNVFSNQVQRGSPWERSQQSLDQMILRTRQQLGRDWYKTLNRRPIRHARDAMTLSSTWWRSRGKAIDLWVNPSDMRWQLPQRSTVVKTLAGTVQNYWGNRFRKTSGPGQYYDEGTVNIVFQCGSILPSVAFDNSELLTTDQIAQAIASPRVPPGLLNFYRFLELYDQAALIGAGTNYHIIQHGSRVFPDITMYGRFAPGGINFSEMATDGNTLQFEATFNLYWSTPRWSSASQLESTYIRFIKESGAAEQLGEDNLRRYNKLNENVAKKPTRVATSKAKRENIAASAKGGKPGVAHSTESAQAAEDVGDAFF